MIQITKTSDLLEAIPINEQILSFGREQVKDQITKSAVKCYVGLGIDASKLEIDTFVEDIIDVYKFDSIEDIQICLKNGRQGKYGKTYNRLNMIVFSDWMENHLTEKSILREHSNKDKYKHHWKDRNEYTEFVLKSLEKEEKKEIKRIDREKDEAEFQKFRAEYLEKHKEDEINKNTR